MKKDKYYQYKPIYSGIHLFERTLDYRKVPIRLKSSDPILIEIRKDMLSEENLRLTAGILARMMEELRFDLFLENKPCDKFDMHFVVTES